MSYVIFSPLARIWNKQFYMYILFVTYISFIMFFVEFFISVRFNVDLFQKQEKPLVEHRFERINRDFAKRHEQFYCWYESAIVFDMEIFSLI